jgi:hypothetical protein
MNYQNTQNPHQLLSVGFALILLVIIAVGLYFSGIKLW